VIKRNLLYLINPISGTHSKNAVTELIRQRTDAAGLSYSIYPTVESGDYSYLEPIIKEYGFTDILIAGGDGTINSVVSSLRKFDLPFGIIPCGSGNGLAFSAGIPKKAEKALDIIFKGRSRQTDAFMINDRFACMLCGLGFDAQVAHDFANDPNRGLTTYIKKTVSNFISAKAYPFVLKTGGREISTEAFFISVANSNQFGNHFTIAPKASLSDGLLDIVVMTKQSKISMLVQAIRQVGGYNEVKATGEVDEQASVLYFQAERIHISNKKKAPMHIDGDPVETLTSVDFQVIKNCFRLIYP
jgi:diacylglycerol kinase (ATP)